MKPWLHLKIVVLLVYVALCTQMVLSALEDDPPAPQLLLRVGE
jgi:hypothetical protein